VVPVQRLYVNANASAAGGLRASFLDASGAAMSTTEVNVRTDATKIRLPFVDASGTTLDRGEPGRLRFTLSPGAHLCWYMYWIE
jgi:hypothetical protein